MQTDRRTRFDDYLFVAVLLLPVVFAGSRYLESASRMNQIATRNAVPATILAKSLASAQLGAANTSIVHRF